MNGPTVDTLVIALAAPLLGELFAYGSEAARKPNNVDWLAVGIATIFVLAGAFIGARLIKKLKIAAVRRIASGLFLVVGVGLIQESCNPESPVSQPAAPSP